jgi:flagellar hook-basal body complex protein FliE
MVSAIALKAYGAALGGGGIEKAAASSAPSAGLEFGQLVKTAMQQTEASTQTAEMAMTQHMSGQAELIDAVTSIASAETSLQSVIAIRDQVIQAYQEIMRMPI